MVPLVQKAGHDVTGLDIRVRFWPPPAPIREIRADLRDVDGSLLKGFDAVIHLAVLSNDPLGDLDAQLTYDINHLATVRLASLAREAGIGRFLFSSPCSNYGAAGDTVLDEKSRSNPVTPYGVSKVRAEGDLLKLASERFSPVLLRSATAYGASPRLRCDIVLNNLTAHAVATGKVLIKSDGTPWRPIVHVEDISRAFVAALDAPRDAIHAEAFNVGRPEENYRVRELAEIVRDTVPGCELEFAGDASPIRATIGSIARRLRPRCRTSLRSGRRARVLLSFTRRIAITAFPWKRLKVTATAASARSSGASRQATSTVPSAGRLLWGAAELTVVKFCRHASGGSPDPSELARPTFRFPAFALIRTDGGAAPIGLARGQGRCLAHPTLKAIAGRHGRTPAQALLRWHIESGFVAIPKSATPARREHRRVRLRVDEGGPYRDRESRSCQTGAPAPTR